MNGRLKDKVALVTGSSRGIGRAIALAFAREGAKVCVNYVRSKEKAEEVADKIRSMNGEVLVVKADVAVKEEAKELIDRVVEKFGRIDILVNNAGVLYRGTILKMDDEEFQRMLDVNVKGIIYCSREAAKHMINNRYGKIINISSVAGVGTSITDTTPYAITKAAVVMLTKRMAFELGEYGINVNAIAPGAIETEMLYYGRTLEEAKAIIELARQRSVLKRIGKPEDIANIAVFLASDESSFITGQVIVADGGRIDYLTHSL